MISTTFVSRTEFGFASDVVIANQITSVSTSELANATDLYVVNNGSLLATITEIASATDASHYSYSAVGFNTENSNAVDFVYGTAGTHAIIEEDGTATDNVNLSVAKYSSIFETAISGDTQYSNIGYAVSVVEINPAKSHIFASFTSPVFITESINAVDGLVGLLNCFSSNTESTSATSMQSWSNSKYISDSITEINQATCTQFATRTYIQAITEVSPAVSLQNIITQPRREYAGSIAMIYITYPFNTLNMRIRFVFGTSEWEEIYEGPVNKIFLNPIVNADLIASFVQHQPVKTLASTLRNIIDMSAVTTQVNDLPGVFPGQDV